MQRKVLLWWVTIFLSPYRRFETSVQEEPSQWQHLVKLGSTRNVFLSHFSVVTRATFFSEIYISELWFWFLHQLVLYTCVYMCHLILSKLMEFLLWSSSVVFYMGMLHFVFGASPQRFLCHFPNKIASFPQQFASFPQQNCFISPTTWVTSPTTCVTSPTHFLISPTTLCHFATPKKVGMISHSKIVLPSCFVVNEENISALRVKWLIINKNCPTFDNWWKKWQEINESLH